MFVAWNQDVFGDDFAVLYFSHPNSILAPKGSIQSIKSCELIIGIKTLILKGMGNYDVFHMPNNSAVEVAPPLIKTTVTTRLISRKKDSRL